MYLCIASFSLRDVASSRDAMIAGIVSFAGHQRRHARSRVLLVADGIIAFSRLPFREVKAMARHAFMTTRRRETASK